MSSTQVVVHSAVPYALGWGKCIATAGNDNKVCAVWQGLVMRV